MTESPPDCGNLLQLNCAIETEECLLLLYGLLLFDWNAAVCLFTDGRLLVAAVWTVAAGGVVPNLRHTFTG